MLKRAIKRNKPKNECGVHTQTAFDPEFSSLLQITALEWSNTHTHTIMLKCPSS